MVAERARKSSAPGADAPTAGPSALGAEAPADRRVQLASLLELSGNDVKERVPKEVVLKEFVGFEVRACRCKSRFCPRCGPAMGYALRRRVQAALKQWASLQMWTLTVDPTLFDGPAEAWEYLRSNRCISRWVRELRSKGHLTGRYFCVVEFHKSGWPHFHILVESDYVPFDVACRAWDRFRPSWAPKQDGTGKDERPGFGIIRFSKGKREFRSREHAANYATKYVIKTPDYGWPDWVLQSTGRVVRFTTSRGFFANKEAGQSAAEEETTIEDDALAHVSEYFEHASGQQEESTGDKKRRTVSERVEECGVQAIVCAVHEVVRTDGVVEEERRFLGYAKDSFGALCDEFLMEGHGDPFHFYVSPDELRRVLAEDGFVADPDTFYERLKKVQGYLFEWPDGREAEARDERSPFDRVAMPCQP